MSVWGLTGGIASGKSLAARFFREEGFETLDADKISHELSAPGGLAYPQLIRRFGTADRGELRKIVFQSQDARKEIENILHPLIRAESEKRIQAIGLKAPILYEATLLVETGRYADFDGLIAISAPTETRIARLLARNSITRELAERIFASQLSDAEREAHASLVIHNDSTEEALRESVRLAAAQILKAH